MKTIKELNEKWYWRFIKVIYIFFVILAIIWSFAIPIWAIFFEKPIDFLSYEKEITKAPEWYYTKKEFIDKSRNKFVEKFEKLSDEEVFKKMIEEYPIYESQIKDKEILLNYYKAIPFCTLMIILTWIIYLWILFLIRWITYYIILWKFNPKN